MIVYLAGIEARAKAFSTKQYKNEGYPIDGAFVLSSFIYMTKTVESIISRTGRFILDSGAFTLFSNKQYQSRIPLEEYTERYATFCRDNKIDLFFELDIDSLIGYERVKDLRRRIELITNRPCIPVWHKSRGLEEFYRLCDKYDYIAIGGIVSGEIVKSEYKYFPFFIKNAHDRGCKLHGLGFSKMDLLTKYRFDSIDSTTWTCGNRFGYVAEFTGTRIVRRCKRPDEKMINVDELSFNNFIQWKKFQQYAEKAL